MALVALALVLSLVAALAPTTSAQDSEAVSGGPGRWARYTIPATQQSQDVWYANSVIAEPRNCAITIVGPYLYKQAYKGLEDARWFCTRFYQ